MLSYDAACNTTESDIFKMWRVEIGIRLSIGVREAINWLLFFVIVATDFIFVYVNLAARNGEALKSFEINSFESE